MGTFSYDIISDYDKAEMNNVFVLVQKDIANRYDFKNTPAAIDWLGDKAGFKVIGENEWQIESIIDIIRKKLTSRNQSSKALDLSKPIITSNLKASQDIAFVSGLSQDKAKEITKILRDQLPKVKAIIQGEEVRVSSGSKDELQASMRLLESQDFAFPLSFTNFR
jgi:cyclic-di-GMP-binding protein